jgi:PAS domain S-box-containing protein
MNNILYENPHKEGTLRFLYLEDSKLDVQIIEDEFEKSGMRYSLKHVDNETEFIQALSELNNDVILSDFSIPLYSGFKALEEVRSRDADIPFIFVSGAIGEELAIETIKRGATDCVNKNFMGKLSTVIHRAMNEAVEKRQHRRAENALERVRRRNILILDSADEGIAGLDKNCRVLFINRSALDMLGYDIKDLLGETIDKVTDTHLFTPETAEGHACSEIVPGQMPKTGRMQFKRKDGTEFSADYTLNTVDDLNSTLGSVLSFRDITARMKSDEDLASISRQMHTVLFESIHAMSTALEFRDPYTAGHQKRVAELASAIARSLGFDESTVDGIFLAGMVHDIGKISVPAEILTRPGKLTDLEFKMIQVHPETGYLILKDVTYPWPIAQAVYQHHERMDGSGYPRGLTGKDTLIEAQIIAVADVVEAMASFRPYRAALGIEPALNEIR